MSEVRLIDANALKEEVNKKNVVGRFNMLLLIDNAPTVKPRIEYGTDGQPYILSITNGIEERPQGDLIKAFELLKAHCKNRECNKDCVFYRELRVGDNAEQFCGLCEIVTSDDKENNND